MFASIRRHQKWMWMIVIVVVIISFVIYFGPTVGNGPSVSMGDKVGTVYGQAITRDQVHKALKDARFMQRLRSRDWTRFDEKAAEQDALHRLVILHKVKEMKIQVTDDEVVERIRQFFPGENGQFSKAQYEGFIQSMPAGQEGLSADDFHRFVRNEIAIGQLISIFGMPGRLVPNRIAEAQFREENEQVATEAVFIQSSNYLAKVEMKTNDFMQLWTNRQAQYFVPEKLIASYVEFPASNYFAKADERIAGDKEFEAKFNAEFTKQSPTNNTPEARAKFKDEVRTSIALNEARRKANEFAEQLGEISPAKPANLATLAAKGEWKLTVKDTEPFSMQEPPKNLPDDFSRAFTLNETNVFLNPILGVEEKAVYIVTYKQRIPGRPQTLDEVRTEFTKDYNEYEARQLARKAANALHGKLSAELAKGKTFKEVVEGDGFKTVEVPAFTRATRSIPSLPDQTATSQYAMAAFDTAPGKISNFRDTSEGGFILHTKARMPADEARTKAELPEYVDRNRTRWENLSFNEWFRREMELARPALNKE